MKICSSCKEGKEIEMFYKDSQQADGHHHFCKDCTRKKYRLRRKKNIQKFREKEKRYYNNNKDTISLKRKAAYKKNRHKTLAHYAVQRALYKGIIKRLPCEVCGSVENVIAHHDDYSKPVDVRWLCQSHHMQHHHGK